MAHVTIKESTVAGLRLRLAEHEARIAELTAQAAALTARFDAAIVSAYRAGWRDRDLGCRPGSDAHILFALKGAK